MADIRQTVDNDTMMFEATSERGRAWMRENHQQTTVRFSTSTELAQANALIYRAVGDGLTISRAPEE